MSELPRAWKIATVWGLLGLALFLGVQAWLAQQAATRFAADGDTITLTRGPDGHYHWPGQVQGQAVEFLVDTGATGTAIPAALAQRLGLRVLGKTRSATAGGVVDGTVVLADIVLAGGVRAERLRVVALPGLDAPLLGMDVLGRMRWQQDAGTLRISPAAPR